jgi:hypothetical protein
VAVDSFEGANASSTSSLSWSHTCSGSNRVLIVGVVVNASTDLVAGVTFNGAALTACGAAVVNGSVATKQYYLANPDAGAHNVVISLSTPANVGGVATSFTGSNGVVNNLATKTGAGGNGIESVTSATGNMISDVCGAGGLSGSNLWTFQGFTSCSGVGVALCGTSPGASTQSVGYTGLGGTWALSAVNITAGAQSKPSSGLSMMGVG